MVADSGNYKSESKPSVIVDSITGEDFLGSWGSLVSYSGLLCSLDIKNTLM